MTVSAEAENLLVALVERVKGLPGVRQVNVFRLEQDSSNGLAELAQPHVDGSDAQNQWRLETKSDVIDELCAARLFEKAPSGARAAPDKWVIRAGIPISAFEWYERRRY